MLGAEDYRGISHIGEKFQWKRLACDILAEYAAVPSLRGGGRGTVPPKRLLMPPFSDYSEYVFGHHVTTKLQAIMER